MDDLSPRFRMSFELLTPVQQEIERQLRQQEMMRPSAVIDAAVRVLEQAVPSHGVQDIIDRMSGCQR
ncbi:hypothetical protein K2Z84_32020 [Candidatus Binatia bacterium]|nr:hypothetical protein [Candidatus Binatia bacterium]